MASIFVSMHPVRRRKLFLLLLVFSVVGCAAGLTLYALRQNISLFYTPSQITERQTQHSQVIRVGGMVVKGSVHRSSNLTVHFKLTDYKQTIEVVYHGILPDLFREGQGIVAQGRLENPRQLNALQVLAKHDENYMPRELRAVLKPKVATNLI